MKRVVVIYSDVFSNRDPQYPVSPPTAARWLQTGGYTRDTDIYPSRRGPFLRLNRRDLVNINARLELPYGSETVCMRRSVTEARTQKLDEGKTAMLLC